MWKGWTFLFGIVFPASVLFSKHKENTENALNWNNWFDFSILWWHRKSSSILLEGDTNQCEVNRKKYFCFEWSLRISKSIAFSCLFGFHWKTASYVDGLSIYYKQCSKVNFNLLKFNWSMKIFDLTSKTNVL